MSDLNNVCLIGRVTQDVEIQYTAKGIPLYCFSIANNFSKQQHNEWVQVPSFFYFRLIGKRWEGIASRLLKDRLVSIQGCLKQDRWERDGKQQSCMKVIIREIQLLWPGHDQNSDQEGEVSVRGGKTSYSGEAETIPEPLPGERDHED
jgi:single-strand DNA-binding protein